MRTPPCYILDVHHYGRHWVLSQLRLCTVPPLLRDRGQRPRTSHHTVLAASSLHGDSQWILTSNTARPGTGGLRCDRLSLSSVHPQWQATTHDPGNLRRHRLCHFWSALVVMPFLRTEWEPLRAALLVSTRLVRAPPLWHHASPQTRKRVCDAWKTCGRQVFVDVLWSVRILKFA